MRYVAVLDCNNFFVSCERLFRPDLAQVPVAVLSSNDGCIVARSQEVKDSGIPMGVPYFQVKDILKDIGAVCFSSHFALYRDISSRVFSVVKEYCGSIEQYSIDEAFFCFERASDEEARHYVTSLKLRVERWIGIPVSIGVSDTKTRAKLVNAFAKKNGGITVSVGDDFLERFGETTLSEVWGVGRQLTSIYRQLQIVTINDLLRATTDVIRNHTHLPGVSLQAELRGEMVYRVTGQSDLPKSIMSTRSFAKKTNDLNVIKDALSYHVRTVFADLRQHNLMATNMRVLLYTARHSDWRFFGGSQEVSFGVPTATTVVALTEALQAIDKLYEVGVPYNKTGVVVYGLLPKTFVSQTLFVEEERVIKQTAMDAVIDHINHQFGRHAIVVGSFAREATWQPKHEQRSPAYTTQWTSLQTVLAL